MSSISSVDLAFCSVLKGHPCAGMAPIAGVRCSPMVRNYPECGNRMKDSFALFQHPALDHDLHEAAQGAAESWGM